jgi:hypothetical protein
LCSTAFLKIKKLREHLHAKRVSGAFRLSQFSHDLLFDLGGAWRKHAHGGYGGLTEKPAEMHMTSKTFVDQQEEARATITSISAQGTSFTWQDIAGHWLRSPEGRDYEAERLARRQAALQRWRGLIPETTARL